MLKLVVGHVKQHLAAFLSRLETLEAMLFYNLLQFIQQQEPEAVYHPCFERHAWLSIFQRLEVVFAEIEIVFVSQREEIHAWLVLQVISLVVDAISHPAVAVVILLTILALASLKPCRISSSDKLSKFFSFFISIYPFDIRNSIANIYFFFEKPEE